MNQRSSNWDAGESSQSWQAQSSSVPWAEIFSRHEALLVSHREMLDSVKGHIASDGEAFRAVSTMLNKTVQAMSQFQVVRKHMLNIQSSEHTASNEAADYTTISQPNGKKKRSRVEKEQGNVPMNPDSETKEEIPVSKRKRNPPLPSDTTEEFQESSYAYETEDISAEVQRRLRIKEETRRKKENMKPDKRKRDSLLSNESSSPGGHKPQKKRVRVESELKSVVSGQGGQRKAKRQKQ